MQWAIHTIPSENLQRLTKDEFVGLPAGAHIFFFMGNSSSPLLYIADLAECRDQQWADIPPIARDAICAIYRGVADVPEHLHLTITSALTAAEFIRRCLKAHFALQADEEKSRA